jgi:hypothetical protein
VASLEPFIDTIIVCSATAIVIIASGMYGLARYQPLHSGLTFDNIPALEQKVNTWIVSEHSPTKTSLFKDYFAGKQLHFEGKNAFPEKSPIFALKDLTKNNEPINEIRFSVYYNGGNHHVELLNSSGKIVKQYPISEPDKALKGNQIAKEWHHRMIPLSPEEQHLALRFVSSGTGDLYIDNIQSVKEAEGITLTALAFDRFFPGFGFLFVCIAAVLFAFCTMITWSYYGETASRFLFGKKA